MLTFLSDVHCINSSTRAITYNDAQLHNRKIRETKQRKTCLEIRTAQQGGNSRIENFCSKAKMRHQSFCSHLIIMKTHSYLDPQCAKIIQILSFS